MYVTAVTLVNYFLSTTGSQMLMLQQRWYGQPTPATAGVLVKPPCCFILPFKTTVTVINLKKIYVKSIINDKV